MVFRDTGPFYLGILVYFNFDIGYLDMIFGIWDIEF